MPASIKVGPNDPCPCWSGKKYKKCCRNHRDWNTILRSGQGFQQHLSIRGRNILFATAIAEALQLDEVEDFSLPRFKKAFTPGAVRKIYEALVELWPPSTDIQSLLKRTDAEVAGLYIGDYQQPFLQRAVVRHSMYADKILLVDPFLHPYVTADEYNPLYEPAQHRAQTLKNVRTFFSLLPWIEAGIVEVIRTPDDFDRELAHGAFRRAEALKSAPDLREKIEASVCELMDRHYEKMSFQSVILAAPDSSLRRHFREAQLDKEGVSEDDFIDYVNRQRDLDPDFLEPVGVGPENGQLHITSTGGTYEIAKLAAQMSGAYLFTDLKARWALIQHDRADSGAESHVWSPFAKAVQETRLNFLNSLSLTHALRLREERRLEGVRSVMRSAWLKDKSDDPFDEQGAIYFAENLRDEVRRAEAEWDEIKSDLAKLGGAELTAGGLLAASPLIATGNASWVAGAAIAGTVGFLLSSHYKQRTFLKRHPAAFFMDVHEFDEDC